VYRAQVADTLPAGVPASADSAARDTLAGAVTAARGLPDETAAALLRPAFEAFTGGMHVVAAISAVLLAGVAIMIVRLLRHVPPVGQAVPDQR
jgi:MFS transporter, DHA2 family, multidrug resistance protein